MHTQTIMFVVVVAILFSLSCLRFDSSTLPEKLLTNKLKSHVSSTFATRIKSHVNFCCCCCVFRATNKIRAALSSLVLSFTIKCTENNVLSLLLSLWMSNVSACDASPNEKKYTHFKCALKTKCLYLPWITLKSSHSQNNQLKHRMNTKKNHHHHPKLNRIVWKLFPFEFQLVK